MAISGSDPHTKRKQDQEEWEKRRLAVIEFYGPWPYQWIPVDREKEEDRFEPEENQGRFETSGTEAKLLESGLYKTTIDKQTIYVQYDKDKGSAETPTPKDDKEFFLFKRAQMEFLLSQGARVLQIDWKDPSHVNEEYLDKLLDMVEKDPRGVSVKLGPNVQQYLLDRDKYRAEQMYNKSSNIIDSLFYKLKGKVCDRKKFKEEHASDYFYNRQNKINEESEEKHSKFLKFEQERTDTGYLKEINKGEKVFSLPPGTVPAIEKTAMDIVKKQVLSDDTGNPLQADKKIEAMNTQLNAIDERLKKIEEAEKELEERAKKYSDQLAKGENIEKNEKLLGMSGDPPKFDDADPNVKSRKDLLEALETERIDLDRYRRVLKDAWDNDDDLKLQKGHLAGLQKTQPATFTREDEKRLGKLTDLEQKLTKLEDRLDAADPQKIKDEFDKMPSTVAAKQAARKQQPT